jgi:hypothetical protein
MNDPRKILIAFQFWNGDRKQMMKVARFLADIEPGMSQYADVLFMSRFDSTQDLDTVRYVSQKFHVHYAKSRRTGVGWPGGCNDLFFGTMDWLFEQSTANKIPDYKAMLIFESDACPLVPDWLKKLSSAWDKANVKVLGSLQTDLVHINGNALYSTDRKFLHRVSRQISGCSPHGGYDFLLHKEWVNQGCANCPLMRSWWRHPGMTKEIYDDLVKKGVVFLHGVKDDSAMEQFLKRFPR